MLCQKKQQSIITRQQNITNTRHDTTRKPQSTMKQENTRQQRITRTSPAVITNTRCTTPGKRQRRISKSTERQYQQPPSYVSRAGAVSASAKAPKWPESLLKFG